MGDAEGDQRSGEDRSAIDEPVVAAVDNGRRQAFRLRGSIFFLTWPRCNAPLQAMAERIRDVLGSSFRGVRIVRELHADGAEHRHAFVCCSERRFISDPRLFDYREFHGNYQSARRPREVFSYVSKFCSAADDDGRVDIGDLEPYVNGAPTHKSKSRVANAVQRLVDGATMAELIISDPLIVMQYKRKLEEFKAMLDLSKSKEKLLKWDVTVLEGLVDTGFFVPCVQSVLVWLRDNVLAGVRKFKAPQLYVWSPPNYGKTSLLIMLQKFVTIYMAPTEETFFDMYDEEFHQLVVFDEYFGQHRITFMNQMLQGGDMTLRKKGSQYLKRINLPMLRT